MPIRAAPDRELIRLEKAYRKAEAEAAKVWNRKTEAQRAVTKRFFPLEAAADRAVCQARAALATTELARAGIVPDHTIVRFDGAHWSVRISRDGYALLDPVKADNTPHLGRNTRRLPRLDRLQITDRVRKEKP